jgi:glutamate-1-semialdehyde aminotransferase
LFSPVAITAGSREAHVQLVDGEMRLRNTIHPNGVDHAQVSRVVEFNDAPALDAALSHGDVACVLTEPVMTNFGVIPPGPGFLKFLREATRKSAALLVIDETHTISCGVGGYSGEHGLDPDMMTLGKAIAAAYPAACSACRARWLSECGGSRRCSIPRRVRARISAWEARSRAMRSRSPRCGRC